MINKFSKGQTSITPRNISKLGFMHKSNLGASLKCISAVLEKAASVQSSIADRTSNERRMDTSSNSRLVANSSRSGSALNVIKDSEYERLVTEKQKRVNRLKESRRKYSKQKLKSK